jgi:GNAT superfamily N-acetyltransferase
VLLAYLVVDPDARRAGAASALLRHVIAAAPSSSKVVCACAPASKGMIRLLMRAGFMRGAPAVEIPGLVAPLLLEYRKTRLEQPMAARAGMPQEDESRFADHGLAAGVR